MAKGTSRTIAALPRELLGGKDARFLQVLPPRALLHGLERLLLRAGLDTRGPALDLLPLNARSLRRGRVSIPCCPGNLPRISLAIPHPVS
jgi:hypothetical protein